MRLGSTLWIPARIVAAALVVAAGAGCHAKPVVGLLCPVTGDRAVYGKAVRDGARLAVEGAKDLPAGFELVEADSASVPATAAAQLSGLIEKSKARLVVGGITNAEVEAMLPVLDKEKCICISPTSSSEEATHDSKYLFRLFQSTGLEAQTAALYLAQKGGVHRLLVLSDGSAFATSLDGEFRKHYTLKMAGRIIGSVRIGGEDWKHEVADLRSAHDPQGVFVIGYADATLAALKELKGLGFTGVRCVTSALDVGNVVPDNQQLLQGVVLALAPYDIRSEKAPSEGFVAAFREKYGRAPDLWAAYGYDAMRVALHTVTTSKSLYTPELMQDMHFGMQDFAGVTGAIAFNDFGEVSRFPVMHCIRGTDVLTCREVLQGEVAKARKQIEDFLRRQGGGGG